MSEVSGQLKRGDLRAFGRSAEGLYHFEGLVRFTGISEGFMGRVERCLYLTEGVVPLVRACAKKFAGKFFGEKIESPAFPNARLSVKVSSETSKIPEWGLFLFLQI